MDERLMAEANRLADKHAADLKAVRLEFRSGKNVRIEPKPPTFADLHGGLKENELLLVGLLPESDQPGVTGDWLFHKSGYADKSYMYRILRRLMKKGAIEKEGSKGYRKAKKRTTKSTTERTTNYHDKPPPS